ncbi:MAG: thioredoxin domain-containing protein [Pseudomonadota bacterium]
MSNQLALETSPYLQQHANNPVNWHPWSAVSLELARAQDKPILLSIGYSACHWCHVMAHESFADDAVAAVMNHHFINIKVDREERPDLDQIYQAAHYMLTQRNGGWPLTMFLSPDGTPFFGGTYFPKQSRYQLPGFPDLCQRVAQLYRERRDDLKMQSEQLLAALADAVPQASRAAVQLHAEPLSLAVKQLAQNFDPIHGGLGNAPKFPHPAELDFLLRQADARQDKNLRHMVLFTLQKMAAGGLYDQLGGGFCRYSVDAQWDIPHFEKMLYDNGLLLNLYCDAWKNNHDARFGQVIEQTASWVIREMQSPQGGYYSSLDADSEHEEGKFYVWQRDEIRQLLTAPEYAVIAPYYGLDKPANFEHRAWNLRISVSLEQLAAHLKLGNEQIHTLLSGAQAKLRSARGQRIRPGRDEKILGSWNGLMIAGMAKAARLFNRTDWLNSAQQAMDFVRTTLWQEGTLLATHKDGKTHLNAYLDDHAFLLNAALELLQSGYRQADMDFANTLADALLARFEDQQQGGFFFTSHDHETLIQRNKVGQDNATPSGNGIAVQALLRLCALTGNPHYQTAAERCLKLFFPAMQTHPSYHSSLCTALDTALQAETLLILRGKPGDLSTWQTALNRHYLPKLTTLALPETAVGLPAILDKPCRDTTTAWLCHGTRCLAPIATLAELLRILQTL